MFTKRKWLERIVKKYSMPEVYCKIANKEHDNFISSIIKNAIPSIVTSFGLMAGRLKIQCALEFLIFGIGMVR